MSPPLQSWSMPSATVSVAPGLMRSLPSLQSPAASVTVASPLSSQSLSNEIVTEPPDGLTPSSSASTKQNSLPLQSWSMPSPGTSVALGRTALLPSLQSSRLVTLPVTSRQLCVAEAVLSPNPSPSRSG